MITEQYHLVYKVSATPFFPSCLIGGNFSSNYHQLVGFSLPARKVIALVSEGTTSWFFDRKLEETAKKIFEHIFTHPYFLRDWKEKESVLAEKLQQFTTFQTKNFFTDKKLNKYGEEQLGQLFSLVRNYAQLVDGLGFLFQVYLTEKFREEIFSLPWMEKEKHEAFEYCLSSSQKTNYERFLFAVDEVMDGKRTNAEVVEEFYWVIHDYLGEIIDEKYVKQKVKESKKNLTEFHLYLSSAEERLAKIKEIKGKFSTPLLKKVETIQEVLYYYTERKKAVINPVNIFIRKIMEEYFTWVTLTRLKRYYQLSPEEIIKVLKGEEIENLDQRSEKWGYLFTNEVISHAPKEYFSLLELNTKDKIIIGTPASAGKVKGRINMILNLSHIYKFNEEEILVAPFTNVNYLPIMSKAKAILTETGGLTSHAAIVSRELKKPCIVGIKNLLLKVKDGDKVEVDANNGIVRIIE